MLQTTYINLEPNNCIFFGKYMYTQFKTQLFSTVSIPNILRYTRAPKNHKCKPSIEKIRSQKLKRSEVFHLVASLEVTYQADQVKAIVTVVAL